MVEEEEEEERKRLEAEEEAEEERRRRKEGETEEGGKKSESEKLPLPLQRANGEDNNDNGVVMTPIGAPVAAVAAPAPNHPFAAGVVDEVVGAGTILGGAGNEDETEEQLPDLKEAMKGVLGPHGANRKSLFVELYLVNDKRQYDREGKSLENVIKR